MRFWLLVVLAGCSFSSKLGPDDTSGGEPMPGSEPLPPDAFDPLCFASGTFYFCFPELPTGAVTISNNIDTTTCNGSASFHIMMIGTPPVSACVIAGDTVTIDGNLVGAFGSRPLVFVSVNDLIVDTDIDASSVRNLVDGQGPNSRALECNSNATQDGALNVAGSGGGAGGSMGTVGGAGGTGANAAAVGGAVPALPTAASLHGGCSGGKGGGATPAEGGPGGGALMFVARKALHLDSQARIHANGGGGAGGLAGKMGGGGGGSGGMIVIHAATLTVDAAARISANGGGGGGGANVGGAADGQEPDPDNPLTVALGAQGTTAGVSKGGNGGAGSTAATPGMAGVNGGGGGGGGAGLIRVLAGGVTSFPAGTISPPPVP